MTLWRLILTFRPEISFYFRDMYESTVYYTVLFIYWTVYCVGALLEASSTSFYDCTVLVLCLSVVTCTVLVHVLFLCYELLHRRHDRVSQAKGQQHVLLFYYFWYKKNWTYVFLHKHQRERYRIRCILIKCIHMWCPL